MSPGGICLLLFAKRPVAGRVKTRLARTAGHAAAVELAGAFLEDCAALYGNLPRVSSVIAADPDHRDPFWRDCFPPPWRIEPQGGGCLGDRLRRAFDREFRHYERVAAVGADHPALPRQILLNFLSEENALWPACDGGYAAILLTRRPEALQLFEEIEWSTPAVTPQTLKRAEQARLPLKLYPPTYDVDIAEDLDQLTADLASRDPLAADYPRHTAAVLSRLARTGIKR